MGASLVADDSFALGLVLGQAARRPTGRSFGAFDEVPETIRTGGVEPGRAHGAERALERADHGRVCSEDEINIAAFAVRPKIKYRH